MIQFDSISCHKYFIMLNIIAKKYSLPVLHNKFVCYFSLKKQKSASDVFKRTTSLLRKQKKQSQVSWQQQNSNYSSINPLYNLRLKDKIQQQVALRQEQKNDDFFNYDYYMNDYPLTEKKQWYEEQESIDSTKMSEQKLDSFFSQNDPNRQKISKFAKKLSIQTKMKSSAEFTKALTFLLDERNYQQIIQMIKKFNREKRIIKNSTKANQRQVQLFKEMRKFLCKSIEDDKGIQQILQLFSKCDSNLIEISQIKKQKEFKNYSSILQMNKKETQLSYETYIRENFQKETIKNEKILESIIETFQKEQKVKNNEILELIKNLDEEDKIIKKKPKSVKLLLKKETKNQDFFVTEESPQKIQKKIFGNKKLVTQQIIFKRTGNKTNQQMNNFGENWVYCYDLPYELTQDEGKEIIEILQKNYGKILEYQIHLYKDIIQKNRYQPTYLLPQNYMEDSKSNHAKPIKILLDDTKLAKKPDLTDKILQKTKKSKELGLNKSSIFFKFANKVDKLKFLTHDLRLFGLNIQKIKNIKFEDAQAKNMIALSMIPWGCESQDLIKVINDLLLPFKISVTHPNCIIARNFIFLQMANFYEAYHAKDFLNNFVFQSKRLKCQIIYGPATIVDGQFKQNIDNDHYETLVQRLSNLRDFYEQTYRQN